jgi:RDD family protein
VVTPHLLSRRKSQLQVAPLRLRLLAMLINTVTALIAIALLFPAGAGALAVLRRIRPPMPERPRSESDRFHAASAGDPPPGSIGQSPVGARLRSRPAEVAFALLGLAVDVSHEGKTRGPGARALGIRLVDARTGHRISRRQALIRAGSRRAWQLAITRLVPQRAGNPLNNRQREDYRVKMKAVRRQFPEDSDARQEAFRRIHDEMPKPDTRGCWLALVARVLLTIAIELPALWSPLKQGLPDKLAGTVHVVEPRGGRSGGSLGGLFGSLTDG